MIDAGVCVKYRPDFLFDVGTHFAVLDVDEHQHKPYPCECEQGRVVNMGQAFGMPSIHLRFNPDDFKDDAGKKCNPSHSSRMKLLRKWLDHCLKPESNPALHGSFIDIVYLYYDGHSDVNTSVQSMQLMEDVPSTSDRVA